MEGAAGNSVFPQVQRQAAEIGLRPVSQLATGERPSGSAVITASSIASGLSVRSRVVRYRHTVFFGPSGRELISNPAGTVSAIFIAGSVGVSTTIDSDGIVRK